jgi:hypothetical protein
MYHHAQARTSSIVYKYVYARTHARAHTYIHTYTHTASILVQSCIMWSTVAFVAVSWFFHAESLT